MSTPLHNLNIQNYSLKELLELFDLTTYEISVDDLKRSKKKVLMLHPDKSKLDSKYFLFYKKAFDVIVQFYDNQHKHTKIIDGKQLVYTTHNDDDEDEISNISKTVRDTQDFQNKFNKLFESNQMGFRPDTTRNEWFAQDQSEFSIPEGKISNNEMGEAFNNVKKQMNGLVRYNGVQEINKTINTGNSLYDDDTDQYICSDPFSKLHYEDLRKVHRDQTVLSVSENDFQNVKTFNSVDEFNHDRNQHSYDPLEKEKATSILHEQERILREQMMKKEYRSKLQSEQYVEKNKSVLASFLQIHNGKS